MSPILKRVQVYARHPRNETGERHTNRRPALFPQEDIHSITHHRHSFQHHCDNKIPANMSSSRPTIKRKRLTLAQKGKILEFLLNGATVSSLAASSAAVCVLSIRFDLNQRFFIINCKAILATFRPKRLRQQSFLKLKACCLISLILAEPRNYRSVATRCDNVL